MKYLAGLTTLLLAAPAAQAQGFDEEAFLALLETDHSPFLLPISFDTADRAGDRLTLSGVDFGWFALDEVAFDVRALAGDRIRLDNFNFPTERDLRADMGAEDQLVWETPTLSLVFNMKDEAPDQIEFNMAPVAVVSATEGFDFALDGVSLSMKVDKDAGSMALNWQTGSGQLVVQNDFGDDFRLTLPSSSLSWSEVGYPDGVHPFIGVQTQISSQRMQLQSYDDPTQTALSLITMLEDLELPNDASLDLQISGFEFSSPRDDFAFSAGPTEARVESNDMRNAGESTGFLSWATNDISFSSANGISVSIGQLFLEGTGEQEETGEQADSSRLMSALGGPVIASLSILIDEAAMAPTREPNPAWRDFFLQPELSTTIEDVVESLGKLEYSYGLRDASLNFVMFSVNLGEFIWGFRLDMTAPDQAAAGMTFRYAGLEIPLLAMIDRALTELLPTDMRFDFDVARVDFDDLVDRFAGLADGDLAPDVDVTTQVEDMIAAWWQSTGAVLSSQGQIDSQATRITQAGTFPFDSKTAVGMTGSADVSISNFSEVKALVSGLADSPDPNIAGSAFGAVTALELLGQFGKIDSKDTLTLDLKLDADGTTTVNGMPLPF